MAFKTIDRSQFYDDRVKQGQIGQNCVIYGSIDTVQATSNMMKAIVPEIDDILISETFSEEVYMDYMHTTNNGTNPEVFYDHYKKNNFPGTSIKLDEFYRVGFNTSEWYDNLKAGKLMTVSVQGYFTKNSRGENIWHRDKRTSWRKTPINHLMSIAGIGYSAEQRDWYLIISNTWSDAMWCRVYYKDLFDIDKKTNEGVVKGIWKLDIDFNSKTQELPFKDTKGLSGKQIKILSDLKDQGWVKGLPNGNVEPNRTMSAGEWGWFIERMAASQGISRIQAFESWHSLTIGKQ